jgi:hypothetical protein
LREETHIQYVIFVYGDGDESTLYAGPVDDGDAAYLRKAAAHFRPLSEEQYLTGPAGILHTAAEISYVLDGHDLYWCIERKPGLLVVRMSPGKELQWVALRSPVPNFGDREPLPEDGDPDEYEENPQYNLIFRPWDAQFDAERRELRSFVPAGEEVRTRFENALARVNALGDVMKARYAADREGWLKRCKQNLEQWCGEGVRLKATR